MSGAVRKTCVRLPDFPCETSWHQLGFIYCIDWLRHGKIWRDRAVDQCRIITEQRIWRIEAGAKRQLLYSVANIRMIVEVGKTVPQPSLFDAEMKKAYKVGNIF